MASRDSRLSEMKKGAAFAAPFDSFYGNQGNDQNRCLMPTP